MDLPARWERGWSWVPFLGAERPTNSLPLTKCPAPHLAKVAVGLHLHHDHHATKEGLHWQGAREPWAEDCEPREPEEKMTLGLPVCPASALLPPYSPQGPGRTHPLLLT